MDVGNGFSDRSKTSIDNNSPGQEPSKGKMKPCVEVSPRSGSLSALPLPKPVRNTTTSICPK